MRRLMIALSLSIGLFAGAATAQEADIQSVIRQQMEALGADDYATAFDFASPSIRGMFGTPDRFGQMVREGYPMVWRPDAVTFGELREVAGRLWQRVIVRDGDGRFHALDYQMIPGDGGWQINGVQILPAPGVGA